MSGASGGSYKYIINTYILILIFFILVFIYLL